MRVVAALGGNALLQRLERPDAEIQEHHAERAVRALATLARDHELVVTHGNGPQVGLLAVESEGDPALERPYPFDVLVAQTQGMIGYWLLQALENALPHRRAAAVVTQVMVDAADPAFAEPTKFVGPVYGADEARRLAARAGWVVHADGAGWRRVVASPEPRDVLELPAIISLLASGAVVVCGGGGGIPVVRDGAGLHGVEAVVDKDLTAALLGERIGATSLLVLTDVDAVETGFGTPEARPIGRTTVRALRALTFPAGSMGPKVEAACRFVERTGGTAAIGRLEDAELLFAGKAGTVVEPG
jgi:carbamate kinase